MGNLCGSVDKSDDAFARPGRTLGSAGAGPARDEGTRPIPAGAASTQKAPKTAPVPPRVGGPARTLGSGAGAGASSDPAAADAQRRAAAAAEARNTPKTTGKLGSKLEAQRRESRLDTLKKASDTEVRRREMDAAAEAASHN
ncbi:hypothetical protein SPI_01303 [Niveomyces insectorum RCEF 264]|uniref:Uncharacterized protein n=1 Tax=Niveomyces insectorum RCEF 264 TaxID=1081102 RepID=A0A167YV56_9HYPO|nr:hypothetical protein SPI_01303 [Niveomyces insectorum RCEF 264]